MPKKNKQSRYEREFWQEVYIEAISAGKDAADAERIADAARTSFQTRFNAEEPDDNDDD